MTEEKRKYFTKDYVIPWFCLICGILFIIYLIIADSLGVTIPFFSD